MKNQEAAAKVPAAKYAEQDALITLKLWENLRKKINNQKAIASSYNSIGSIYLAAHDIKKALEFYIKSLSDFIFWSEPHLRRR